MQELHGYYLEDLEVGMSASYAKTISEADVYMFAGISGDNNPIHINEEYAATTPFKQRIVHGMFSAALISTVAGTRLPAPGLFISISRLNSVRRYILAIPLKRH